jgi:cytidine deaminase
LSGSDTASERLVVAARDARTRAVVPYSGFAVGAALETRDGAIVSGCNIENASYGLTMCAERVALFKALSEGAHEFTRLAVVTDTPQPTPPCGACRQLLWEYCGDVEIVLANLRAVTAVLRMRDLLPMPFDRRRLKERDPDIG